MYPNIVPTLRSITNTMSNFRLYTFSALLTLIAHSSGQPICANLSYFFSE